jgi:hypothetical protein
MTDTSITTISIKRLMFKETSERNSPSIDEMILSLMNGWRQ